MISIQTTNTLTNRRKERMKRYDFNKLWPDIKNRKIRIKYGYQQIQEIETTLISMEEMGQDTYLKTQDGECLTIRPIHTIKIIS